MTALRCVLAIVVTASLFGPPRVSTAQPSTGIWRVGYVGYRYPNETQDIEAFRERLAQLGYVEGKNLVMESRVLQPGSPELSAVAMELVRLRPDVVLGYGNAAVVALKRATATIPIVIISAGDPVGSGLVRSLPRPGANVTGLSNLSEGLTVKWLELLTQIVPGATRLGVLMGRHAPNNRQYFEQIRTAGQRTGITVLALEVEGPGDIDRAFGTLVKRRAQGLIVVPNPVPLTHEAQIVALAARHRVPAIYPYRHFAERGGLMSYSADRTEMYRQAAVFVDKILRGARPADLPVEQPTRFELTINLATAKALGLTIPPALLGRIDRVIE